MTVHNGTAHAIKMPLLTNYGCTTPTTFKPGDIVSIKFNPLRDGAPGGSFTGPVDANEREYNLR